MIYPNLEFSTVNQKSASTFLMCGVSAHVSFYLKFVTLLTIFQVNMENVSVWNL